MHLYKLNISARHLSFWLLLFNVFKPTRFKNRDALFSNLIGMKFTGEVFEAVQTTHSTCLITSAKKMTW